MINTKDVYMSAEATYEEADIVMFGVDFDGTCSFRPGTRFGPSAVRRASYGLETFSWSTQNDLETLKLFDRGDLGCPMGDQQVTQAMIEETTATILKDGKVPFMIGGEHSISYPSIKAVYEVYPDLKVIQLDAHADLRETYMNNPYSHACVMNRVVKLLGSQRCIQWGIRSGTKEEFAFAQKHTLCLKAEVEALKEAVKDFSSTPIYLTVDVDVIDPSLLPGTGTPEPGGITYSMFEEVLKVLSPLNIVGLDMVELSPDYDHSGVSSVVVAKMVRQCLMMIGEKL
jgi:agmatinase